MPRSCLLEHRGHIMLETQRGSRCRSGNSRARKGLTSRPEPMKPVDRLSHRLSVTPVSSHFQALGSDGTCIATDDTSEFTTCGQQPQTLVGFHQRRRQTKASAAMRTPKGGRPAVLTAWEHTAHSGRHLLCGRPEQHLLGGGQLLQLARVRALSALRLPRRHLLLLARAVVRLVDTKKCNWSGQGYCWHVHHIYVKPAPRCAARNGFTSPLQALAGSLHACSLSCHHLLLCDDEAGAEQLQQTPRQ